MESTPAQRYQHRMSNRKFRAFKNYLRQESCRASMDSFAGETSFLDSWSSSDDDLRNLE